MCDLHTSSVAHTLDMPGAQLYYEVRGSGPTLLLLGAPMDSSGFAALAALLATEHTVLTCDPRGTSRSSQVDSGQDITPHILAADAHRVLAAHGCAPATVLGSPLIEFPGDHGGFATQAQPFAAILCGLLSRSR